MFGALRQVSRSAASLRAMRRPGAPSNALRASVLVRTLITKRYTEDHEVVTYDDTTGIGTVAITDYAQASLGDVVFVELPEQGTKVDQGEQIGAVESVKAASDIFAPISGTVEAINEVLNSQPGLLNKSPEEDGWLCKIKLADPSELEHLMTEEGYKAHCEK